MACSAQPPSLIAPGDPTQGLLIAVQGFDAHAGARGPRGGGSLIVVGQFPEVTEGQEMCFTGEWVRHSKFGQQLRATQWEHIKPDSDEGLISYLSVGASKGVSPAALDSLAGSLCCKLGAFCTLRRSLSFTAMWKPGPARHHCSTTVAGAVCCRPLAGAQRLSGS